MKPGRRSGRNEPRTQQDRLLAMLALAGARARRDGGAVRVYAPRNSVSVQIGVVALAVADMLVTDQLAIWRQSRHGTHLDLTAEGVARARRDAAPESLRFRAQHGALRLSAEDQTAVRMVEAAESPLVWLYRRGNRGKRWLGEAEFTAGERLRSDLTTAQMMPRMTARWDAVASGGAAGFGLAPGEAALAARQRVQQALEAVGADLSGLLVDVCGFLKGLDAVERERGWPARSAKVVLQIALARLAAHYGYGNAAVGRTRRGARHMWGAEGFRPDFPSADVQPNA